MTAKWDLNFIYKGYTDPQIDEDLGKAITLAEFLSDKYRGRIKKGKLNNQEMLDLFQNLEEVYIITNRVSAYGFLLFSQETTNEAFKTFYSEIQQRTVEISNKLIWVSLEISGLDEEIVINYLKSPSLENYTHYIKVQRLIKPFILSEPEEKIISEKDLIGARAWEKFYNEFTAAFQFECEIEGERKTLSPGEIYPLLRDPSSEVRETVFKTYYKKFENNSIPITHAFNNIFKDHGQNMKLRKYPAIMTEAHIRNQTDEKIVKTMMKVIKQNHTFVEDYYKLKAKLLGEKYKLKGSDLYAPLGKDVKYTWEEARDIVLSAFTDFDLEIGNMAGAFFERNLIDSEVRKTKMIGAFNYGFNPDYDPVILMSFNGTPDSVSTLAHELGHGLHSMFAGSKQTILNYHPSTVIAETASVFGEQILIDNLIKELTDEEAKLKLIANQIENAIITICRQTMYVFFEEECHQLGANKNLSSQELCDIWDKHVRDFYGNSVEFLPEQSWNWSTIPHFLDHRIFYCYAYSFGMLFVLGLYQKYLKEGKTFIPTFKSLLKAGGSKFPIELAESANLDITNEQFWQSGFDYLNKLLIEFQMIVDKKT